MFFIFIHQTSADFIKRIHQSWQIQLLEPEISEDVHEFTYIFDYAKTKQTQMRYLCAVERASDIREALKKFKLTKFVIDVNIVKLKIE